MSSGEDNFSKAIMYCESYPGAHCPAIENLVHTVNTKENPRVANKEAVRKSSN